MNKIINIAVIAHVDAGKSTLVNGLIHYASGFNSGSSVQSVMDYNDLEQERGITIYSKNCAINYEGVRINIVDTPGHADFSSEVERIMKTVDTVILLVDSSEGPMPQTRFVLKKALEENLTPILLINKIDKEDARIEAVIEEVYELFFDLGAQDHQIEFPILYGITRDQVVVSNLNDPHENLEPLLQTILNHTRIKDIQDDPFLFQVSSLAYDNYLGRLGIGRIFKGSCKVGDTVRFFDSNGNNKKLTIRKMLRYEGLERVEIQVAQPNDIIMMAGIPEISIGNTLSNLENTIALPSIAIEEPTLSMLFHVNNSPFAGKEGKYITSRNIWERLMRELEVNVGLRVEKTTSSDTFRVYGRGELHLSILIETMRREGYEFALGKPEILYKEVDGIIHEPYDAVIIETPSEYSGKIIQILSERYGTMLDMHEENHFVKQSWIVPVYALLGFRQDFINMTRGEASMVRSFHEYAKKKSVATTRVNGSMISNSEGMSMNFPMFHLQQRGEFFIPSQTPVYQGMIVGSASKSQDIHVNVIRNKRLNSFRGNGTGGKEDALKLKPHTPITIEFAMSYIQEDELVEVTPQNIRLRKI